MEWLNRLAKYANNILMIFTAIMAAIMITFGLYALNDIYYTNKSAFISYDLLKYRPAPHDTDKSQEYKFSELRQINSDTVGWIEMFGTNINYPVVHGRDNLEYLNKDIFGYSTLTGSIYLAAENNENFSDWYNLIYGHHMENGAMFGDIEKYLDPEYFSSHSEGILQTAHGDYNIKVLACIRTDAYEDTVYQVQENAADKYPVLREYIRENAVTYGDMPDDISDMQIFGMSTCSDAVTDGRIVLFAVVKPWDSSMNGIAAERMANNDSDSYNDIQKLTAVGHDMNKNKWSFLNLMCLVCTFLTLLPVWALKRKYSQWSYSHKKMHFFENNSYNSDENNKIISDLKHFNRKFVVGIICESVILIVSIVLFFLTEDIHGRMGIRDRWTGIMILAAASALVTDFICLRYRGIVPEEQS